MRLILCACIFALAFGPGAHAEWRLVEVENKGAAFTLRGDEAPDAPPGSRVVKRSGGDIVEAWYAEPTRRYGHGVIGDAIEAGALVVRTSDGELRRVELPNSEVFEDVDPRLADLDGDGRVEVTTIRSSVRSGASVAIYGLENGELTLRAATPFIGRSHRWLNIAAIAPFLGGRTLQIAYVETPHIGGTLRLLAFQSGAVTQLADDFGYSNHAIGAYELRLAAATDLDGDGRADLVLPDQARRALRIVSYRDGVWRSLGELQTAGEIQAIVSSRGDVLVRLSSGRVYALERAD